MKPELIYVELTLDHSHTGPAWIGYGLFNRTRKTVYFNGRVLSKGKSDVGNFFDIQSGEEFWVSGVKKNGEDRHWAGSGKISLDSSAIDEYLTVIGETKLPPSKFLVSEFDNVPKIELATEIKNKKLKPE